ncbi:uncharacterized protein LOC114575646 [Exaiptasia diaphana]|uniref:Transposase n=1 Tax=Exaiptasia diaphana TaxID=2652724 RepID=A0A913YQH2_EXADI|nr:uncharacterized protein LOC114575646 [Exaiptasia diaphana]
MCSDHFCSNMYKKLLGGKLFLEPKAIPLLSPEEKRETNIVNDCQSEGPGKRSHDYEIDDYKVRSIKQQRSSADFSSTTTELNECNPLLDHSYYQPSDDSTEPVNNTGKTSTVSQTDLSMEDINQWFDHLQKLREEKEELSSKLNDKANLKRELFLGDVLKCDESVKFYTGIPSGQCLHMLLKVHETECKKLKYWEKNNKTMYYENTEKKKPGPKRTLSLLQEFILTLVRLRLGLTVKHLSNIFSISESQASRIYATWVCFLSASFKDTLVSWPSKKIVKRKLPRSFRKYPGTRVIIDCTEMFVEKPSSPYAQKATWSEYKEHNTIKTLVGITPNGYFSFMSKFWTGNTSDCKITQESGLVDLLEAGDVVMADKGFNIKDILTKKEVYLNIPPFAKKGKQLSRKAVMSTRQIAQVRIHVERAIERLK